MLLVAMPGAPSSVLLLILGQKMGYTGTCSSCQGKPLRIFPLNDSPEHDKLRTDVLLLRMFIFHHFFAVFFFK